MRNFLSLILLENSPKLLLRQRIKILARRVLFGHLICKFLTPKWLQVNPDALHRFYAKGLAWVGAIMRKKCIFKLIS